MQIIINQLDRTNPEGGVVTVHWSVQKTSGEFVASQYGTESFTPDPSVPGYVPFEQLTKEIVTSWLLSTWGTEGVAAKEAALDVQLDAQANPPVLSGLPWEA